jgi:hypothetical protein
MTATEPTDDFPVSARLLGATLGLNAMATKLLLRNNGILEGGPGGVYRLTDKGREYARVHNVMTGPQTGYGFELYDPKVLEAIDTSTESLNQARSEASAHLKALAAARKEAQAAAEDAWPTNPYNPANMAAPMERFGGIDRRVIVAGCFVLFSCVGYASYRYVTRRRRTRPDQPS